MSIHGGVGLGVGNWFDENLGRVVGDGVNSCFFFLDGCVVGGGSLCD